jgi:hypothetical protein
MDCCVSPNHLSPTPSTFSAMKTPDPQSPDPSASLVQTEEVAENIDAPEPAADGDIKLNYSSDYLGSPNIGTITKIYL